MKITIMSWFIMIFSVFVGVSTIPGPLKAELQLDPDVVGLWHMNENIGNTIKDETENHNDGVIHGAQWVTGRFGSGLYFDGSSYVDLGNGPSVNYLDDFTVEAWIKPSPESLGGRSDPWQGYANIVTKPGFCGFNLAIHYGHLLGAYGITSWYWVQSGGDYWDQSGDILQADSWTYVTFSHQYAGHIRKLYINGVEVPTWQNVGWSQLTPLNLVFGQTTTNPSNQGYFGVLDEVRITRRVLTPEEILANSGPQDVTPPVITAGTPIGDEVLNGWWVSDVTVPFSATDDLSGFAPDGELSTDLTSKTTVGEGSDLYVTSDGISDMAGNTAAGIQAGPFKVDKTPPEIEILLPEDESEYLLNQEVLAVWTAEDTVSGIASASGTVPSGLAIDTSTVGTKTFTVTATDNAGNTATKEVTYYVMYDFSGILPPINADGSSVFKLGSTIPVKFQLRDGEGSFVGTAVAKIYVAKITDSVIGTEEEGVSTSSATTGNLFRYDLTDNQYIFNLATKPLSAGTWQLRIDLDDGTSQYIQISLRK